jgi:hypothetical protein
MTDYTANAYGIDGDHKYTDRTTAALGKNRDPNKGQKCVRFVIAADTQIMGGEIWVNADTVIANSDGLNITVLTTV